MVIVPFIIKGLNSAGAWVKVVLSPFAKEAVLAIRKEVRAKKDFTTADLIRDELKKINIIIKDTKDGVVWEQEK